MSAAPPLPWPHRKECERMASFPQHLDVYDPTCLRCVELRQAFLELDDPSMPAYIRRRAAVIKEGGR